MRLPKEHLRRKAQETKVRLGGECQHYGVGRGGASKGDQGEGQLGECKAKEVKGVEVPELSGRHGKCS